MTPRRMPRRGSRRALIAVSSVALVALIAAVVAVFAVSPGEVSPTPPPGAEEPSAAERFERPGSWSTYRPAVHLTPQEHWMNDPQRPFFLDGRWHFYYLYNDDHPDGNGTAWYHVTSTDLVHWRDEGVAIDKYRNGLGDIWTGSVVVDESGSAGFGAGAVIALATQQVDGVQRQSLFVSQDGGYSFSSYEGNPVMENPGEPAWRDPKIVWDDERAAWLMLLAEGQRIGFYTSPDLKTWTHRSSFARDDLGVLECPDLFPMAVEGDAERTTWVLGVSANGEQHGRSTGYAYWTGAWDGHSFTPDADEPRWLDGGSDFYAAVTWPTVDAPLERRYAIGWMNNWAYAGDLPTSDWSGGVMSLPRELTLRDRDGGLSLASRPVDGFEALEGAITETPDVTVMAGSVENLAMPEADAFRLRISLREDPESPAREARIHIAGADGSFATVGYDFAREAVFVARDADAAAPGMPDEYRRIRTERVPMEDGAVRLDVIVDRTSIEVFAQDGAAALSSLAFLGPGDREVSLSSVGGNAIAERIAAAPLAVAAPERR